MWVSSTPFSRCAAIVLLCTVLLWPLRTVATPSASAPPPDSFCAARVIFIAALDGTREASSYAVLFQAAGSEPGLLSGTVTFYAGESRYDVPFADLKVYPQVDLAKVTPLVVHFSSPVSISAVYLSAIAGPDGGPCALTTATQRAPEIDDAFTARARKVAAVDAPAPVRDPAPCAEPYVQANITRFAVPDTAPDTSQTGGFGDEIHVMVHLAADGSVMDATSVSPAKAWGLQQFAVKLARSSHYTPEIMRCKPVEGYYEFVEVIGASQGHVIR
jgi:hypothetical protein